MAHAISYQAAIEYALDGYREFKKAHENLCNTPRGDKFRDWYEGAVTTYANITCAQQEMICRIYGMSEEKVHDDLEKLLARDNELVYV